MLHSVQSVEPFCLLSSQENTESDRLSLTQQEVFSFLRVT